MRKIIVISLIVTLFSGCYVRRAHHNFYAGIKALNVKKYEYAINYFNKAIKLNKNYSEAYYNRGEAYNYMGKYTEAKNDYQKAVEIKPTDENAHRNLGLIYAYKFDDLDKAIKHLEIAIMIKPFKKEVYNDLEILAQTKLMDYATVPEHQKKAADIYFFLGIRFDISLADYESSKKHYQKAIEIKPDFAQAYYNLARLLDDKFDDRDGAKINYLKAIEYNPNNAQEHFELIIVTL